MSEVISVQARTGVVAATTRRAAQGPAAYPALTIARHRAIPVRHPAPPRRAGAADVEVHLFPDPVDEPSPPATPPAATVKNYLLHSPRRCADRPLCRLSILDFGGVGQRDGRLAVILNHGEGRCRRQIRFGWTGRVRARGRLRNRSRLLGRRRGVFPCSCQLVRPD